MTDQPPTDTTPEALTSQQVIDKMTALMQEQPDGRYLSAPETWNELLAWLRALAALPPPAPQGFVGRAHETLVALAALPAPAPQVTRYPCHCGIGAADLLDWVDSGLTLTCRTCGVQTVVSLQTDPASQGEPALALHYSGEASKPFWEAINATGDDALYTLGCTLQEFEQQTLAAVQSLYRPPDAPGVKAEKEQR